MIIISTGRLWCKILADRVETAFARHFSITPHAQRRVSRISAGKLGCREAGSVQTGSVARFEVIRRGLTPPSRPNRRHQAFNADHVDGPSQIIGKRRQAELGANFFEALGEKGALIHPYVDGPLLA